MNFETISAMVMRSWNGINACKDFFCKNEICGNSDYKTPLFQTYCFLIFFKIHPVDIGLRVHSGIEGGGHPTAIKSIILQLESCPCTHL